MGLSASRAAAAPSSVPAIESVPKAAHEPDADALLPSYDEHHIAVVPHSCPPRPVLATPCDAVTSAALNASYAGDLNALVAVAERAGVLRAASPPPPAALGPQRRHSSTTPSTTTTTAAAAASPRGLAASNNTHATTPVGLSSNTNNNTPANSSARRNSAPASPTTLGCALAFPAPTNGASRAACLSPFEDSAGRGPAHYAAAAGHTQVVRALLAHGFTRINAPSTAGRTPLHFAAYAGHAQTCEFLLEAGASAAATDNDGCTPALLAASAGHCAVTWLLLRWGLKEEASMIDDSPGALDDVAPADHAGRTALHHAAAGGHLRLVRTLVYDFALDVHATDHRGWTPLMAAASEGRATVVRTLIKAGADGCAVELPSQQTVLHIAAASGDRETVAALCELAGADIRARNAAGALPADVASSAGHAAVTYYLTLLGFDDTPTTG